VILFSIVAVVVLGIREREQGFWGSCGSTVRAGSVHGHSFLDSTGFREKGRCGFMEVKFARGITSSCDAVRRL